MKEPMCIGCRRPYAAHIQTMRGLECPDPRFYTPCQHLRHHGWGAIGMNGWSDGELWCDDCGEQIAFKRTAS